MSRSGYSEECDGPELIMWRGAVNQAIHGKRGQKLLREMAHALDAMPEKILIARELVHEGEHCALGVVGAARGIDMTTVDPEESDKVAKLFDIAEALAKEIVYINDDAGYGIDSDSKRWERVRKWVADHIKAPNITEEDRP